MRTIITQSGIVHIDQEFDAVDDDIEIIIQSDIFEGAVSFLRSYQKGGTIVKEKLRFKTNKLETVDDLIGKLEQLKTLMKENMLDET